jgi:hypothetical protein
MPAGTSVQIGGNVPSKLLKLWATDAPQQPVLSHDPHILNLNVVSMLKHRFGRRVEIKLQSVKKG